MYVIYLNSEYDSSNISNAYGYWTGRTYKVEGEYYPITTDDKNNGAKIYKNKKVAQNAANRAYNSFGYVLSATVEEYLK